MQPELASFVPQSTVHVLHIVDRDTGGVPEAAQTYINNSPTGFTHSVLTPPGREWYGIADRAEMRQKHSARISDVRRTVRQLKPDIVHAHSSFAGVYARLGVPSRTPVIYTPHAFAFTRRDIGALSKMVFRWIETVLGYRTSLLAGCSKDEVAAAESIRTLRGRTVFIPNVASVSANPRTPVIGFTPGKVRIGMSGRLAPQKDPAAFMGLVRELRGMGLHVDAKWIGDGEFFADELRDEGISITGWLDKARLVEELAGLDVYIHSAAWEGFPLAVLDAHALDLPISVRAIDAFTGIENTIAELNAPALAKELKDSSHFSKWRAENRMWWRSYLADYTPEAQAEALAKIWSHKK